MNTIFASFSFNLMARVVFSGQAVGQAMTAFFVWFFINHPSYGFTLDIPQLANEKLGEQVKENQRKLLDYQYRLTQGMQEEDPRRSQAYFSESFQEILTAYIDSNPQALGRVILQAKELFSSQDELKIKLDQLDLKNLSPDAIKYMGLLANLIIAKQSQGASSVELFSRSERELRKFLSQSYRFEPVELSQLNAEGLLQLTQFDPPFHTKENKVITWVTSIVFGVVIATVLASKVMPMLMDPTALSQSGVILSAFLTCVKFTAGYYLLLGQRPWEYYISVYHSLRSWLGRQRTGQVGNFSVPGFESGGNLRPGRAGRRQCQALFY